MSRRAEISLETGTPHSPTLRVDQPQAARMVPELPLLLPNSKWGPAAVIEQTCGVNDILLPKGPPFSPRVIPPLGSLCPPPEERHLSMPEIGKRERNYLFKSYTDLE